MNRLLAAILFLCVFSGGCVERTLTIKTDPPGALVVLNDIEVGRTPFTRNFVWYGTYDVEVRKDGYQTLRTQAKVWAPWWQWVPFDFFTEFLPLHDHHEVDYSMKRISGVQVDPNALVSRGEQLRSQLESSQRPTTQPAVKPKKKKEKDS